MDRQRNRWMDGWMIDEYTNGWIYGGIDGWMDEEFFLNDLARAVSHCVRLVSPCTAALSSRTQR